MSRIDIIGAGVIGRTLAIRLLLRGFEVRVWDYGNAPSSSKAPAELPQVSPHAAAFWLPFAVHVSPPSRERRLSEVTLEHLLKAVPLEDAGVHMVECRRYFDQSAARLADAKHWWRKQLGWRKLSKAELPKNVPTLGPIADGYRFDVPALNMRVYLDWLRVQLQKCGGERCGSIISREITSIADLKDAEAVVICAGGYANRIQEVPDKHIVPLKGILLDVHAVEEGMPAHLLLNENGKCEGEQPVYVLPFKSRVIVGGLVRSVLAPGEPWPRYKERGYDQLWQADDGEFRVMLDRAQEFWPELKGIRENPNLIGRRIVAPRPSRGIEGPRVGYDPELSKELGRHVLYNYGHGGSGITFSVGSAELIEEDLVRLGYEFGPPIEPKAADFLISKGLFGIAPTQPPLPATAKRR